MWYDSNRAYLLNSNYSFTSLSRQDNSVRRGSYERLINNYYGKNSLFKRTLPQAGNYQFLDINEATKDVEGSLQNLLFGEDDEQEAKAEELTESYNKLLRSFDGINKPEFASRRNWLTALTSTYAGQLHEAGYVIAEDGTLQKKLGELSKEEKEDALHTLFTREDSYGKHLLDVSVKIGYEALSSLGRSPKLYNPNGSFIYTIMPGTLYNEVF